MLVCYLAFYMGGWRFWGYFGAYCGALRGAPEVVTGVRLVLRCCPYGVRRRFVGIAYSGWVWCQKNFLIAPITS